MNGYTIIILLASGFVLLVIHNLIFRRIDKKYQYITLEFQQLKLRGLADIGTPWLKRFISEVEALMPLIENRMNKNLAFVEQAKSDRAKKKLNSKCVKDAIKLENLRAIFGDLKRELRYRSLRSF